MLLTVAICTRNRAQSLERTLQQMTQLTVPTGTDWELVVVNNNSTDHTDDVIATFSDRLPVRRLCEPNPGKSYALNHAIRSARGEYILWTDDDVLVDPCWLSAYREAFAQWPDAAVFGGPIDLQFAGTPPPWLLRVLPRLEGTYARVETPDAPTPVSPWEPPFGANLAIRTREQARHLYDVRLGPQPSSPILYEDVVCVWSILATGATGWWVPRARVRHCISESRQTVKYIRRHFFGAGLYVARTSRHRASATLFGKPRWMWRSVLSAEARFRFSRLFRRPEVWITDLIDASILWGRLRGLDLPPLDLPVHSPRQVGARPGASSPELDRPGEPVRHHSAVPQSPVSRVESEP